MSNGHTPGPWRWMAGGLGPKDDDGYTMKGPVDWGVWESKGFYDNPELFGGDGESVVVSGGGGEYCPVKGETPEEQAANARLIAAAPAMLEALQDALSGWRYIRQVHGDLFGVGWDRVEEKAKAAIELATKGAMQ